MSSDLDVCEACAEKDSEISRLTQHVEDLRSALRNAHTDPDMVLACLDTLRSQVVDQLRQKYLQVGTQQR